MPIAWVLALGINRAYEARFLFVGSEEYRRAVLAGLSLTAGIAILAYAANVDFARGYIVLAFPLLVTLDLTARHRLRRRLNARRAAGQCMHRVVVLGYERPAANLIQQLLRERFHGMDIVGACLPTEQVDRERLPGMTVPVYGSFANAVAAVKIARADTIAVLPSPEMDATTLRDLSWELEGTGVDLVLASALMDVAGPRTSIRPIDGLPLLHVEPAQLTGAARVVKRGFDLVFAGLAVLALLPLFAVVAVLIRLTSRGRPFFVQTRVGKDGREFRLIKFRSMYADAEGRLAELQAHNEHDGPLFKMRHDPRITPIGKWLRRFTIDELPQLINVVRGDMSLVGPRPPLPGEVAQYGRDVRRRLAVTPGLTGLWQVSGRSNLSWEDSVRLDIRYVENWSLSFDLVILARTFAAVLRTSGAY
jgi:exopolysaccharide biosynthesis polyprenyl glycosylphosphotransferase